MFGHLSLYPSSTLYLNPSRGLKKKKEKKKEKGKRKKEKGKRKKEKGKRKKEKGKRKKEKGKRKMSRHDVATGEGAQYT